MTYFYNFQVLNRVLCCSNEIYVYKVLSTFTDSSSFAIDFCNSRHHFILPIQSIVVRELI